jgi:hypothetical protein
MKTLNVTLEDTEYDKLAKLKGDLTWHDFLVSLVPKCINLCEAETSAPRDPSPEKNLVSAE